MLLNCTSPFYLKSSAFGGFASESSPGTQPLDPAVGPRTSPMLTENHRF